MSSWRWGWAYWRTWRSIPSGTRTGAAGRQSVVCAAHRLDRPQAGQFQHNFAWQFIQLCNPELALAEIQARAMSNEPLLDYQI
jgi:hypothetical protein